MVSAGHPLAAHAALTVLEAGGNAVDAGVAAGFALNVTQPDMANLGGVAPVLIHMAERNLVTSMAGIGHWPKLATLEAVKAAGNGRISGRTAALGGAGRAGCLAQIIGIIRHDFGRRGALRRRSTSRATVSPSTISSGTI